MLRQIRVSIRLSLTAALIITAALSVSCLAAYWEAKDELTHQASLRLDSGLALLNHLSRQYGAIHVDGGALYAGDHRLDGDLELVDTVKSISGSAATIFRNDERVATNVKKADGTRAVGTKLARGPVYDALFTERRTYRGDADVLGRPYFAVYQPIPGDDGTTIGVLFVGLDKADLIAMLAKLYWSEFFIGLAAIVFATVVMLAATGRVLRPLSLLGGALKRIGDGDLGSSVPFLRRTDEIGQMAHAVQSLRSARLAAQEELAARDADRVSREQKQKEVLDLARDVASNVEAIADSMIGASRQIQSEADGLAKTSDDVGDRANILSDSSAQATADVQNAASAAQELSASISEVRAQVTRAASIAETAVDEANSTNQQIVSLSAAARRIGEVVKLITAIANQTNLLALNATIEAARAGEQGRGFAVVASEVKSLANQTTKATEEIEAEIAAVQAETERAVSAIQSISGTITDINNITAAIASSIDQQTAATSEIASRVQSAADGTASVSGTIDGFTVAAGTAAHSAAELRTAASSMEHRAASLNDQIGSFVNAISAA